MVGENVFFRFDSLVYEQIVCKLWLWMNEKGDCYEEYELMVVFIFLRMCESLFYSENWRLFVLFVCYMEEGWIFQFWEEEVYRVEIYVDVIWFLV